MKALGSLRNQRIEPIIPQAAPLSPGTSPVVCSDTHRRPLVRPDGNWSPSLDTFPGYVKWDFAKEAIDFSTILRKATRQKTIRPCDIRGRVSCIKRARKKLVPRVAAISCLKMPR